MDKQIIIAIGRECGSGGRFIAELVGKKLGIDVLDKNMLDEVAEETAIDLKSLEKYDEKAKIISRLMDSAKANEVTSAIWDHISAKAARGDSFVVVGRCAEEVLKSNPNLLSVFICGERYDKFARIVDEYGFGEVEAEELRKRTDFERGKFHDKHSDKKWGDPASYDFVVNSSKLGIEGSAEAIIKMIDVKAMPKEVKVIDEAEARRKEQYIRRVNAGF